MPKATNDALASYRQRIDALDDQLIALLKDRIQIIAQVGDLKRSKGETGLFLRPGREGQMLERIYNIFSQTDFHPVAATAVWRQLIAASTHLESPLSISAFYTDKIQSLYWLAREHFGSFAPIKTQGNAGQVIADIRDGHSNIGILPYPDVDADWWSLLSHGEQSYAKIFAYVPAAANQDLPRFAPYGLAIANITPEPSGHDWSYFAMVLEDTMSTSRLHGLFDEINIQAQFINTANQPPMRSLLIRLDGFYDLEHNAIQQLAGKLEGAQIYWIGAHPAPVNKNV